MRNLWLKVKGWYQRARFGYSEQDLWNFDTYMADVIARALAEFKQRSLNDPNWGSGGLPPATDEIIKGLRLYADKENSPFAKDRGRKALRELADVYHKYWD